MRTRFIVPYLRLAINQLRVRIDRTMAGVLGIVTDTRAAATTLIALAQTAATHIAKLGEFPQQPVPFFLQGCSIHLFLLLLYRRNIRNRYFKCNPHLLLCRRPSDSGIRLYSQT